MFLRTMKNGNRPQKKRKTSRGFRILKAFVIILLLGSAGYFAVYFLFPLRCSPSNGDLARAIQSGDPVKVNSVVMASRESFSRNYRIRGKSLRQLAEETCNKNIVDLVDYALDKELVDILLGK